MNRSFGRFRSIIVVSSARAALLAADGRSAFSGGGLEMCTLTFIPKPQGYLLGMNRDERLTRELALAPTAIIASGLPAVYPREQGGGTWIGSNSSGITFALLNQNPGSHAQMKERSRGGVIP